jgi:hypothetical protein
MRYDMIERGVQVLANVMQSVVDSDRLFIS